jgi:hypothetical protein
MLEASSETGGIPRNPKITHSETPATIPSPKGDGEEESVPSGKRIRKGSDNADEPKTIESPPDGTYIQEAGTRYRS